jgi:hypothetical protein
MIRKVGRYGFLENLDLPFLVTDHRVPRRDQSSSWRTENPRRGCRLQRGAARSSFGVVADNDLHWAVDPRLEFSILNLSVPQVLPGSLGYQPLRTCRPVVFGQFQLSPQHSMSASTTRVFALSRDELGAQYGRATPASPLRAILEWCDFCLYGSSTKSSEGRS